MIGNPGPSPSPASGRAGEDGTHRTFLVSFFCAFAVLTALVLGFNAYVDPYGLVGTGKFPVVAVSKKIFELKRRLIGHLSESPQILLLGSSTILKSDPRQIERDYGKTAFNAGVPDGSAADAMNLLAALSERFPAAHPTLLWALDIEVLIGAQANDHSRGRRPQDDPSMFARGVQAVLSRGRALAGLLDFDELLFSFRSFLGRLPAGEATFTDRGFRTHDFWDRLVSDPSRAADLAEERLQTKNELIEAYRTFASIHPDSRLLVERLADWAGAHRCRLIVYLPPIQPALLAEISAGSFPDRRREAAEFLSRLGKERGFAFFDFTEIASFSGSPDDFYDGVHMKSANFKRLLDALRAAHAF